ncbi:unnamed protein product [Linum tenue]|uniref:Cytochrome P450 n=1 Tax=Linum tenue TaxID=586396 RepID=A0AAV0P3I9_9ROSI|nr:unnamed protein product [Linum tenue]
MDQTIALYSLPAILLVVIISKLLISSKNKRHDQTSLPPSPPSLPFIGHLHLLKEPIHRTLQTLSQQYGPIYLLSMGVRKLVVVSSPSLAEECFNKNDVVLANRPNMVAGRILNYNYTTVGAAPYGPLWRNLRRLTAVELLSTARLNIVMRMVAGKRYFGSASAEEGGGGEGFQEVISEVFELSGASNPGDFLPVLRWIGYGGMEKRMWRVLAKFDAVFQGLIDERRKDKSAEQKTMIDTFLDLQKSDPQTYSDDIIKGQVMTMITAGTDTSATTIEWAMSLLLNHPNILTKARAELDDVVGNNRLVEESDYAKLPYLQNIINETLRLYPAAPLLVPHYSSEDCTIGGYHIPKGTMLMANAWAIQRDPSVWDEPTTFRPERHEGKEADAYKLLPFGMGRRSCPGTGLANRVVSLALGALIQCFEWTRVGEGLIDMSEGKGLTMPKVEPLVALCKARECMKDVLVTA